MKIKQNNKKTRKILYSLFCIIIMFSLFSLFSSGLSQERIDAVNRWSPQINDACNGDQICVALIKAVMSKESHGVNEAVSWSGCAGLMQFCYSTAYGGSYSRFFPNGERTPCCPEGYGSCSVRRNACKDAGYVDARFVPEQSINAGAAYLMRLYNQFNQNIALACIAYNAGPSISLDIVRRLGARDATFENIVPLIGPAIRGSSHYQEEFSDVRREQKIRNIPIYTDSIMERMTLFGADISTITRNQREIVIPDLTSEGENTVLGNSDITESYNISFSNNPIESEQTEQVVRGRIGTYSVRPSVKAKVNYNFNEYDRLKIQVQSLVNSCSGQSSVSACILREISEFNSGELFNWNFGGCDESEEKISNEFLENFQDCMSSEDENCLCTISIRDVSNVNRHDYSLRVVQVDSEETRIGTTETGRYKLIDSDGKSVFDRIYRSIELKETEGRRSLLSSVDFNFFFTAGEISHQSMDAEKQTTNPNEQNINFNLISYPGEIRFAKNENSILFSRDNYANSELPVCTINKRTHKFCVESKNYEMYHYDGEQTSKKNLTYRFALTFEDGPPPIVTRTTIIDAKKKDKSIIISWDKSPDSDVSKYHIYFSSNHSEEQIVNDVAIMDLSYLDSNFERVELSSYIPRGFILENFEFDSEPQCRFEEDICIYEYDLDGSRRRLEAGRLYYVTSTNKLFMVLPIAEDETDYLMVVLAEDRAGNKLTNPKIFNYAVGRSIDDLAPGIVDFEIIQTEEDTSLSFDALLQNIDGTTQMTDFLRYKIYSSDESFSSVLGANHLGSSTTSEFSLSNSIGSGTYNIAVTSEDDNGNEHIYVRSREIFVR